jgi:hypothetical protein
LYNAISSCSYDFIALTETWLNDSVLDSELCNNNNYYTLRSDRDLTKMNLSRGGGVLLASRREFIVDRLDLSLDGFDDLQFTDILGVKIVCHKFCLYMFLVYIHPKSTLQ